MSRCSVGSSSSSTERLLGQRASQHHALLFAAGDFVHPAVGQMLGADLREGVLGDGEIVLAFKP